MTPAKRRNDDLVRAAGFVAVLATVVQPCAAGAGNDEFRPKVAVRRPLPAVTEFPVATAEKARGQINDAELVLGVVVNGQPRAYPINMLTGPRREILNDTLGGRAIAATW